jgi:predicted PurR-regulated permease PerM
MNKLNALTKSLFTFILVAALSIPTVNAAEQGKSVVNQLSQEMQMNAQHSLAVTLQENLNEVITTINGELQKDMLMTIRNNQSLVIELASSQSIKDDKVTSSVSE